MRCETWCRHYFRIDGRGVCAFGNTQVETEKGAPCMGRKESRTTTKKQAFSDNSRKRYTQKTYNNDNNRCRTDCRHYSDGACTYGVIESATEEGAMCTGRKEIRRRKLFDFHK